MVRGEGVRRRGAELASSQEAIESRAEYRPKHVLVVKWDGGGVVQSLFELAKNVDGSRVLVGEVWEHLIPLMTYYRRVSVVRSA